MEENSFRSMWAFISPIVCLNMLEQVIIIPPNTHFNRGILIPSLSYSSDYPTHFIS